MGKPVEGGCWDNLWAVAGKLSRLRWGRLEKRRVRHNQQHVFRQSIEHLGHEACRTAASTSVNRSSIRYSENGPTRDHAKS